MCINNTSGTDKEENDAKPEETEQPPAKRQKAEGEDNVPKDVVEEGLIYFFYRPRVAIEEAHSLNDVQRFYMVLSPDRKGALKRLIVIAKKKLPANKERFFGFVGAVGKDLEGLTSGLGPQDRETKTQGTRHTEPARVVGKGRFTIIGKKGQDTNLVWRLEVPKEPGDIQKDLSIGQEGSLHISIKNPAKGNPPNAGLSRGSKADFGEKQKLFEGTPGGYAWIPAHDPAMLDVQNCELLLIGGSSDLNAKFGKDVEEHLVEQVEKDKEAAKQVIKTEEDEEEKLIDKMKEELKAETVHLEVEPAEGGEWK
jgi:hypothetical protein